MRNVIKLHLMHISDTLESHKLLNLMLKKATGLDDLPSVWIDRAVKELEREPIPPYTLDEGKYVEMIERILKESGN